MFHSCDRTIGTAFVPIIVASTFHSPTSSMLQPVPSVPSALSLRRDPSLRIGNLDAQLLRLRHDIDPFSRRNGV